MTGSSRLADGRRTRHGDGDDRWDDKPVWKPIIISATVDPGTLPPTSRLAGTCQEGFRRSLGSELARETPRHETHLHGLLVPLARVTGERRETRSDKALRLRR